MKVYACNANLHDLREQFEFAHAIAVAIGNNCPTAKWRSWAMTSTPSSTATPSSTTTPTTAATTPAKMDHRLVNPVDPVGPPVPQMSPPGSTIDALGTRPSKKNTWGPCRQLKTAKVTWVTNGCIPIGYDETHSATPMVEQHSALAHDIGHVMQTFCPMPLKSWKVMPEKRKNTVRNQLSTNYNLEDMDADMFAYLNQLFCERYKQWKNDLHHYMRTSFWSGVGALVREKCAAEWESWRAIPEELKMHMIDELATNWDIDKSNPNLMRAIDNMFRSRFQEWKFDNQYAAELQREP
ncbi:hypothetical protein D8674_011516 [Pyrus ussuriensis x Pyrus communis]|uniref:Uncharacterized protein n=1 Tax=Pyrus ussuriensis x Pyrus communis TaxID=2448454 RepID=A0A5N5FYY6_9ROSA|nr:hypothetical protein D8674_011516 [Pyrus ussuriensis x Pyrus communis]